MNSTEKIEDARLDAMDNEQARLNELYGEPRLRDDKPASVGPITKSKPTLSAATNLLLFIAADAPALARYMGLEILPPGVDKQRTLKFLPRPRPWLVPKYEGSTELTFSPDIFAKSLGKCSTGERHMGLWLLNVWNPQYAHTKRWRFDLFDALNTLDQPNRHCIVEWLKYPVWP